MEKTENNNQRMPLIGDRVPDFGAQTTQGFVNFPEDYKGKWVVLFSHPGDFTPVCTTEFHAFQEKLNEFRKMGTSLIGLSIDQVYSHIKWLEWIEQNFKTRIEFPVIADDRGKIAERLGMIHPGRGNATVRAVFVIDPEGIIRTILYYPPELGRNMDEIIRIVRGLQISDLKKVVLPANWPNNSLIGDKVIVPPAKTEQAAKENRKKYDCFDWWLCYKDG